MGIRHEEVPGTRRRVIAVGLRILKVALLAPLALVGLCVCINRVHLCFSRCELPEGRLEEGWRGRSGG